PDCKFKNVFDHAIAPPDGGAPGARVQSSTTKLGGHDMKRIFLASTIIATWASVGPQVSAHGLPPSGVAPRASCTALTGLNLPNTQILSATQKSGYCNVVGIINKRVSTQ